MRGLAQLSLSIICLKPVDYYPSNLLTHIAFKVYIAVNFLNEHKYVGKHKETAA
jgi:hypothetical protein